MQKYIIYRLSYFELYPYKIPPGLWPTGGLEVASCPHPSYASNSCFQPLPPNPHREGFTPPYIPPRGPGSGGSRVGGWSFFGPFLGPVFGPLPNHLQDSFGAHFWPPIWAPRRLRTTRKPSDKPSIRIFELQSCER